MIEAGNAPARAARPTKPMEAAAPGPEKEPHRRERPDPSQDYAWPPICGDDDIDPAALAEWEELEELADRLWLERD
jgi:hypothetical protein